MEKIVLTSDIESIRFEKDNGGAGEMLLLILKLPANQEETCGISKRKLQNTTGKN